MNIIAFYNAYIRRVVALLAGVIGLSVFLYGTLLLGAVSHTALRTSVQKQAQHLSGEVSVLESKFLNETKALSPEWAAALGFVSPQAVATIYAAADSLTLR